jgi:dGTP triphosphohydrolase
VETLLPPLSEARRKVLDLRQYDKPEDAEQADPEDPAGKKYRTGAQRDRDRILYCSSLHRLAYVTQVTAPESGYIFHNRLSHSLKVAQADDVTFAVHDADDFFRAGLVPLDRLADPKDPELQRFEQLLQDAHAADPDGFPKYPIDGLVATAQQILALHGPTTPYEHTVTARATLRDFGSKLITRYLDAFSLADDPTSGQVKLTIDEEARREVTALKMMIVVYVVRRPGLAVVQHGQQRVVRDLFD